jgi:hypothetical protein
VAAKIKPKTAPNQHARPRVQTWLVIQAESGAWEIGQLKASRNYPLTEQTIDLVEQWLRDWRFSCLR